MKNAVKDLEISAYQMSDEELDEIMDTIFFTKTEGVDLKNLSNKELDEIMEFCQTIPYTKTAIDTLASLNIYEREYLEAENRRLYEEQSWKRYL